MFAHTDQHALGVIVLFHCFGIVLSFDRSLRVDLAPFDSWLSRMLAARVNEFFLLASAALLV